MSRLIVYLFFRNPMLPLLIGVILIAIGLLLGWVSGPQINYYTCSSTLDCQGESSTKVYFVDWNKDLIVFGPAGNCANSFCIIYPSRFSPSLDRATFKTNASIIVVTMTIRNDLTDPGATFPGSSDDFSGPIPGSIVEQLSWKDARGLEHTSATDLYRANPHGFREPNWLAGGEFYSVGGASFSRTQFCGSWRRRRRDLSLFGHLPRPVSRALRV